jgi:O-antigen ligase
VVNVQPRAAEALRLVFVRSSDDSSVEARTADYREVDRAVGGDVWAGHGIGQWETYRTPFGRQLLFDNQYLLTAEETGVLGLVAFAALLATAFRTALRWVRTASGERTIAVAVLACLGSFAVMSATFDALYFSQAASLFMFLFGIASAAAGDRSRPDAMPS